MRRAALALLALAACSGAKGQGIADAGGADLGPPPTGMRAFDVTATLAFEGSTFGTLPVTTTFSLALDLDGRFMVAGSGEGTRRQPLTTTDGRTFSSGGGFQIAVPGLACNRLSNFLFESLEVTVGETSLRGHVGGMFAGSTGTGRFYADLVGEPDATAPFVFKLTPGATFSDPFSRLTVAVSEPLSADSKAWIVGTDGSRFEMVPILSSGAGPLVTAFDKPEVVLPPGVGYSVDVDGLVDLAGNSGASGAPLRLGTIDAAPLLTQDGFESATGATVSGAAVVRSGALLPIAGAQSVYLGTSDAPGFDDYHQGPRLLVRMAVHPGDTKLAFTYRSVTSFGAPFAGSVLVGSPGGRMAGLDVAFQAPSSETMVQLSNGTRVTVGGDQTMTILLPDDAHDEVVVSMGVPDGPCGKGIFPVGLLVDDLRLE